MMLEVTMAVPLGEEGGIIDGGIGRGF